MAPAGGEEADVALAKAVVVRQAQFSWEGDVQRQVQYEMEKKASEARLAKIRASSALGRNRKPPTAAPVTPLPSSWGAGLVSLLTLLFFLCFDHFQRYFSYRFLLFNVSLLVSCKWL